MGHRYLLGRIVYVLCDICGRPGPTVVYRGKNVCSVNCEDRVDAADVWIDSTAFTVDSWLAALPKRLRGTD
jgi:hypothetical protein